MHKVPIIDSHLHIWDLKKVKYSWLEGNTSILNKTYLISEIEEEIDSTGITGAILIQAANNYQDTDLMLESADKYDLIKGVVGWVNLLNPDESSIKIEDFKKNNYIKGFRHLIHDEIDNFWIVQEKAIESLKIICDHKLTYDVVGTKTDHLKCVQIINEKIPELKTVLDHLCTPPISKKEKFGEWGEEIKIAAQNPNVFAKISGLGLICNNPFEWNEEDILPYVDFVIETFGADRCMIGGDWPVALLADSYSKTWEKYFKVIERIGLTENEKDSIFYKTASTFYNF